MPDPAARQSAPQPGSKRGGKECTSDVTPLLIDSKAAATRLNISPRTLWSLTRCDAIPHRRIGALLRYCPEELSVWIAMGCPTNPGSASRVRREVGR